MTSWIAWVGNTRGPRVTSWVAWVGNTRGLRDRVWETTHALGSLLGAPRGQRVRSTHSGGWGTGKMTSKTRMARGKGAPRGRRVEKSPNSPSNTTNVHF